MKLRVPPKLRAVLKNPFFVVVPLIAIFVFGWHQYLQVARGLNEASHNLLAGGGFDHFDRQGVPVDWTLTRDGTLNYQATNTPGFVKGRALSLQTTGYKSGDLLLTSTKTAVKPGQTYLFKGYYSARGDFELLIRMYFNDGTSRLSVVHAYGSTDSWSTVSDAFEAPANVDAVQFAYHITSSMTLHLDDTYLEAKPSGVYLPPASASTPNLITNADLSQVNKNVPKGWSYYHTGNNKAVANYDHGGSVNPYVRMTVTGYKDGEAKWQYAPQPVSSGQAYRFGVDYTSDVPADVVAEYTTKDGKRQFAQVATLSPASRWTHADQAFEVPAGVSTMFVSVVLHGNGTLGTDNYELHNITKSGARQFDRPLVSITFDDGWQSAYTNGAKVLDQLHLPGTYYINPSTLDTPNFMSAKQVQTLLKSRHQVASHGYEHLDMTAISTHRLNREFKTAHDDLVKQFSLSSTMDYASPYGKSDAEVQYYVRQYYRSQRSTDSGINTRQNFDAYNLKVFYVGQDTSVKALQDALNQAKASHGWLILVYHRVEHKPGDQTAVEPGIFRDQMNAVKQSGVAVDTVSSALQDLQNQL